MSRSVRTVCSPRPQWGAALLAAMLTVALVASFAATALWQQWQAIEVESAERTRVQASWILTGAADWARLILVEDARSGGPDHLAEPWAVPLQEARLSSFLATDKDTTTADIDLQHDAFLSGQIEDMQSRLNVLNLVADQQVSQPDMLAFKRLFAFLRLPLLELSVLAENLRLASDGRTNKPASSTAPLMPQRMRELAWLGVSATTLARLEPYATLLPERTAVNLNTASLEVIYASVPGFSLAQAQKLKDERARNPFRSLEDVMRIAHGASASITPSQHSVTSRFFKVSGRLRLEDIGMEERFLLQRDGLDVKTLWREKAALDEGQHVANFNEATSIKLR